MKKIFLTGSTGFVGKNIIPILKKKYSVYSLSRSDLDLKNQNQVIEYFSNNEFDVILHCANPNPKRNVLDENEKMIEDSIRLFQNIFSTRENVGKIIYLGSGAEYDKSRDICQISEEECFRSVPNDSYGLAKYTMNQIAMKSENVYNLCIFGCYGPWDAPNKFITHCIRSILLNKSITIRKDCWFDYLHVYDLAKMMSWMIDNNPKFHMYNACSGTRIKLSDIATLVNKFMGSDRPIKILQTGFANEYTASNKRLINEADMSLDYPIEKGIEMQIIWEKENWSSDTIFDGE